MTRPLMIASRPVIAREYIRCSFIHSFRRSGVIEPRNRYLYRPLGQVGALWHLRDFYSIGMGNYGL